MLKIHVLLPIVLLAAAPAVAHADDLDALCSFAKKASHDDQLAIDSIRSQLWKGMSCDLPSTNDLTDSYDAPVLVHVANIITTFGDDASEDTIQRYRSHASTIAYSISKLDRARFDKETAKAPAGAKKLLGAAFDLAASQAKAINTWRAAQKGSAKKVWVTAWDDAIAAVDKDYAEHGAEIQLAISALAKAKQGDACPDVRGRLGEVIAKAAPKTTEDLDNLVHRLDVQLLLAAIPRCLMAADDETLGGLTGYVVNAFHVPELFRGPADRVANAIHGRWQELRDRGTEGDTLQPDRAGGRMVQMRSTPTLVNKYFPVDSDGKGNGVIKEAHYGEVATKKAAKAKGFVTLTFKKVIVNDRDLDCVRTNKVERITENGDLEYGQSCTWGKPYKRDVSPWSVDMPASFADAIKPGTYLYFYTVGTGTQKEDHRMAIPLELYANKTKKQLIGFLGAAVK